MSQWAALDAFLRKHGPPTTPARSCLCFHESPKSKERRKIGLLRFRVFEKKNADRRKKIAIREGCSIRTALLPTALTGPML